MAKYNAVDMFHILTNKLSKLACETCSKYRQQKAVRDMRVLTWQIHMQTSSDNPDYCIRRPVLDIIYHKLSTIVYE